MKILLKLMQVSLIIMALAITSQAQIKNDLKTNNLHIGYVPISFLSATSYGVQIGYSKLYHSSTRLVGETQLSYTFAKFQGGSDFFQRGYGYAQIFNGLAGGRLYFTKRKNGKGNVYLNALGGLTVVEGKENGKGSVESGFGYSFGLHAETKNNFTFGFAIETAATAVIKGGFYF